MLKNKVSFGRAANFLAKDKVLKQAISACEWALCQMTVCFEFQSRSERTFPVTTDLLNREFQSRFCSAMQ